MVQLQQALSSMQLLTAPKTSVLKELKNSLRKTVGKEVIHSQTREAESKDKTNDDNAHLLQRCAENLCFAQFY